MTPFFDLAQIVLIDLSLAADNALVVGVAVASLPPRTRKRVTTVGIAGATFLRIVMAFFAVKLLQFTGLLAAGGLLLLWVGWKMVRELHAGPVRHEASFHEASSGARKFSTAVLQIIIADVSMSLDNVLAVAGIARDRMGELVIGLVLSVALMGFASTQIAKVTARYPKVAYLGIVIVFYTALRMMYDGTMLLLA